MPKIKSKITRKNIDLQKVVMEKIKSGQVEMKPKWYFVLGSILMTLGFVSLTIGVVFMSNLTLFLIRKRGPGIGRLSIMFDSFPLWIPILAVLGIALGLWFLKKYDFSYKKNYWLIITGFIASIFMAAFMMDFLGLNEVWSRRGPMNRFYQQIENNNLPIRGQYRYWKK